MEFLNSVDSYTTDKKSSRVRSWYLYEQFKSLERNQLEAAKKLKDRSYQERILHREISERRARRKLYDQIGICDTQSVREKSIKNEETKSLSISTDDVFESFCELKDDESDSTEQNLTVDDRNSQDGFNTDKVYADDFKSMSGYMDNQSCDESTSSEIFVDNAKSFAEEIKEELEFVKKNISENITIQLENVEGSLQCLEDYSELYDDDKVSETETYNSHEGLETDKIVVRKNSTVYVNNMIAMWSKLVSFAYNIINLNHGCYNDYGSQFFTAVLACDVLRRGINRMCDILQPYVSPIKFAIDDSGSSNGGKIDNRNKKVFKKNSRNKYVKRHPFKTGTEKNRCTSKDYHSENYLYRSIGNRNLKTRRTSEPLHSVARLPPCKQELTDCSESTIWPKSSSGCPVKCNCSCRGNVVNPMIKIAHYFDRLLEDIEDCKDSKTCFC